MLQEKVRTNIAGRVFSSWSPVGRTNQGAVVSGVVTDFCAGVLKETGRETDLALAGEGFFAFEVADTGQRRVLYSRDGELHTDGEGCLVNSRGHRILGESGYVQVGRGSFTVDQDGVLTTADKDQVRLRVVEFTDKSMLVKEGDDYFSAPAGEGIDSGSPGVAQGFLERSNVDVSAEMVNMIEIFRAYEASQKLIQAHDQLLDSAINRVGTVK
jgi:flagellar basal-body rod protein FlgG